MKYAFTHGKLLDGTKDMQVQEGLCVLTDGERISAIVPEGTPLDGYTVVDLQGRYLMPGLINMHVRKICGLDNSKVRLSVSSDSKISAYKIYHTKSIND